MKPPSAPVVNHATSQTIAKSMETTQSILPWAKQLECHLQVTRKTPALSHGAGSVFR
jgi:hypothetical protein